MDTLNMMLRTFMDEYASELAIARKENKYKRPFGDLVRKEIAGFLKNYVDSKIYKVKGSVGGGRWTDVPWIAVMDKRITNSPQKGVYIVYLLNKDSKTLYLTLNQGATDVAQSGGTDERKLAFTGIASAGGVKMTTALKEKAVMLRSQLPIPTGASTEVINSGSKAYDAGCVFSKMYRLDTLPQDEVLISDLQGFIKTYKSYYLSLQDEKTGGEKTKRSVKEYIEQIKNYIASEGFSYEDGLIENFYLSLKSKPFVILAGTSGTGKTRLVKLFAEAIGATSANGHYKMVSVRPDWSDSTDLFGHVDLNGHFIPGAIIDFVKNAQKDIEHPYVLCLDEMNLARVEYYLSDFLSVIETRDFDIEGRIETIPLVPENYYGSDDKAEGYYGRVLLPENLYVVGTVNMDETTFPFSKKVLDRANTIEFSYVDLMPVVVTEQNVSALNLSNQFLKTKYLILQQCRNEADAVEQYCTELKTINEILQEANAHIGYRIRDEIVFYLLNNKEANLISDNDAFDNEILQKILPRIQGSSASIKDMLCDLFKFCAGDYEGIQTETDIGAKMLKKAENPDCKYKKSAKKIAFMVRRYEEDGFTSYWL